MDNIVVGVGLLLIGTLIAAIAAMVRMYLTALGQTISRIEKINQDTMKLVTETKDRLNTHIGDSTYRFDVLRERLARLEKTSGDLDELGDRYQRRELDTEPQRNSNPPGRSP